MIIRLGSRGSQLALTQANSIAAAIRELDSSVQTEIVIIQTRGDRVLDAPLSRIGGKGVFTKEIEVALLEGRIDLAVHSLKDLPTTQPEGLALAAVPRRESPRDVLVAARHVRLQDLGPDEPVGTSSLRRAAQLRARFPNLPIKELRGNVPTRIRKMLEGQYAAIILAQAGMRRLQLDAPYVEVLGDDMMVPAPGQGALGLQIRAGDTALAELLAPLGDAAAIACVTAERTLLDALGGGCQLPLGASATMSKPGRLVLRACVVSLDGTTIIGGEMEGATEEAAELGRRMAQDFHARGAADLIAALPPSPSESAEAAEAEDTGTERELRVLVTRDEDADGALSRPLRQRGVTPVCLPLVHTRPLADLSALSTLTAGASTFRALIVTSAHAVEALTRAVVDAPKWLDDATVFCTGEPTAQKVREAGFAHVVAGEGDRDSLLAAMEKHFTPEGLKGLHVLYLRGNLAPLVVDHQMQEWGCVATTLTVYETRFQANSAALIARLLETGSCTAVSFCSASAVEAFAELVPNARELVTRPGVQMFSIGASTTAALRSVLPGNVTEAHTPSFEALADCIATSLQET